MKQSLKTALAALVLASAAGLLFWGSGIAWASFRKENVNPPQLAEADPPDQLIPGGDAKLSFDVTIPENLVPGNAEVICGKGSVAVDLPRWQRLKWRWNRSVWRFSAGIRAIASGEIPEGKIEFNLNTFSGRALPEKYTVAIPAFSSTIPSGEKAGGELLLAGVMTPPHQRLSAAVEHVRKYRYWYIAGVVLLAAAAWWMWRFLRRKIQPEPQPCWEIALAALAALEARVRSGELLPIAGYTALMDILRNYLEIRFSLPASRRTTAEFLPELARHDSPLPESCRMQLSRFFASADLIRFAKAPADSGQFADAANQLASVIRATITDTTEKQPEQR